MKQTALVVAPHPDDETLGCGGTLLRHARRGDPVHWLILTAMTPAGHYSAARAARRKAEIRAVAKSYPFAAVHSLGLPAARLDAVPKVELVKKISAVFTRVQPEIIYLPHFGDAHTDHRIGAEAAIACTKWFRQPSLRRVLAYETLSETDFGTRPFVPSVFVDVSKTLERKIEILKLYGEELGDFPFPRSETAVRALAALRGAASGFSAAESFELIKELIR